MTYLEVCCILLEIQVFSRSLSGFGFFCVCVCLSLYCSRTYLLYFNSSKNFKNTVYFAKHSRCTWKYYVPCHGCGKYSVNVDVVKLVHCIHSKFLYVCGGFLPMLQITGRGVELFTPVCFPISSFSLTRLCLLYFEPLLLGVHFRLSCVFLVHWCPHHNAAALLISSKGLLPL